MNYGIVAPWHRESYDRFVHQRLPALLAERLPLADYAAGRAGDYAIEVRLALGRPEPVTLAFELPACDAEGVFEIDGCRAVVSPIASCNELDTAQISCVGEQLYDHVAGELGEAPDDLTWDEALARSWLPLDRWVREYLTQPVPDIRFLRADGTVAGWPVARTLDEQNWLARQTHLLRILLPGPGEDPRQVICPQQRGRVCPFETPEGRNIGRILTIAVGAAVRDGRLVIVDDSPAGAMGLSARMIPCIEHSDANRLLMGVNMMRQWVVPAEPEPAVVRTGLEPDDPAFWCGRNLLTAFISWGGDTYEDGIVVSESAAGRLGFPDSLEPGDKLSNRHGTKGVVARILPDEQMPHLADGTAVELIFSFLGCHTRLNFGQIREAVLGRIARAEGRPMIVPPFQAPSAADIRARCRAGGLSDSGMETLTAGRSGPPLDGPSTVGWVYWGKTHHLAAGKLHASTSTSRCNLQADGEYAALRDAGAVAILAETFNLRSVDHPQADTLADRVAAGPVEPAGPPTPALAELIRRLAVAGIEARLEGEKLRFGFSAPVGETLALAAPVRHPWLGERELTELGTCPQLAGCNDLLEANDRMARVCSGDAPASLRDRARARLADAVARFLDDLLTPAQLCLGNRVMFSGRGVIAPGPELSTDQLGLPAELAWTLFGPLAARQVGRDAVTSRTDEAAKALEAVMAGSWVLLNRAPTLLPTSILAFRPVLVAGRAIRLPLLATRPMNADFDGDQAAVFLPLTEAAQREAGEKLSLAAWLGRHPQLASWVVPSHAAVWGLAALSRTQAGCDQLTALAGRRIASAGTLLTRRSLIEAMRRLIEASGASPALQVLQRLMRRGLEVARRSGASLSPLFGGSLQRPPAPDSDDPWVWLAHREAVAARIAARRDFDAIDMGPQLLAVMSGARGRVEQLTALGGVGGAVVVDADRRLVPDRYNFVEGYPPEAFFNRVVGARVGLAQAALHATDMLRRAYDVPEPAGPSGFGVLARAMQSAYPGIVFANAAAFGEADPLVDLDSRLFVGLPPG